MATRIKFPKGLDVSQLAKAIVDASTGNAPEVAPDTRNAAAVALGRKGGLKGGKARAAKLSKAQLTASARKAALARWKKKRP